jgi:hypothetical protein
MTGLAKLVFSTVVLVVTGVAVVYSSITPNAAKTGDVRPDSSLVDRIDKAIQERFLIKPQLGVYRIAPKIKPNTHLREFVPEPGEEYELVKRLKDEGWKVNLYLFGRSSVRRSYADGVVDKHFTTTYRTNLPVPITLNVNVKELEKPETLLHRVEDAFDTFQLSEGKSEPVVQFESAGWFYVARPVRASSEACLACHADSVITDVVIDGQPTFRNRRVGDVNGVLFYGFRKD